MSYRKLHNKFKYIFSAVIVGIFLVFVSTTIFAQSSLLGDIDGDADVDVFDFNVLTLNFGRRAGRPDPTNTPGPFPTTGQPSPTSSVPTPVPPPGGGNIQPFSSAQSCESIGLQHDNRTWHGIWSYEYGCHWDHEHKRNPHDLDNIFGTEVYDWFGSDRGQAADLSYPWQTYAGAYDSFENYVSGTATENNAKHEGYNWLYFRDKDASTGALLLGSNTLTDARIIYHQVGGQVGAFTRFHSMFLQARACNADQVAPASQGVVSSTCGTYSGGGWVDLGRLNYPRRGDYAPLAGDPPEFNDSGAELAPYRIHATGQNSLDSWQTEGNEFNFLPSDPTGSRRLMVGYGIHFDLGESTGETDPGEFGKSNPALHLWCVDPVTKLITCDNNNSAAALFRTWVKIPRALDGSSYDEDGSKNGYFTFNGYTNRYGDIVEGCTSPGLDCVPARANHFPIGGCTADRCKAAYRGDLVGDLYDADLGEPLGVSWIKYPN